MTHESMHPQQAVIFMTAVILLITITPVAFCNDDFSLTADDYAAAESLDTANLAALVKNGAVEPHWISGGDYFWYRRDEENGHSIALVDTQSGVRKPAFDVGLMATALDSLIGADSGSLASSPDEIIVASGEREVRYQYSDQSISCAVDKPHCRFVDNLAAAPELLVAPEGGPGVFVRNHNLWLRDLTDGAETALTKDGERYAAYAGGSDQESLRNSESDQNAVSRPRSTHWSPGGQWLITRRLDEREVEPYPFLESVPVDGSFRPKIREVRVVLLGDASGEKIEHCIIDIRTGSKYPIKVPDGFDLNDAYPGNMPLGWSSDGMKSYLYVSSIDAKVGKLIEVDLATGETRAIIEEHAPGSRVYLSPFGSPAMVRIVGDELIWFSERSNFGHLYLYDLKTGKLKRQLTQGDGSVNSMLHVDVERRSLLISRARGKKGIDPYQQYIYRISLDGGKPVLLTPEIGHHVTGTNKVSPDGDYFIDSYSTISVPPKTVLRSTWETADIVALEDADAVALFEIGWRPPERVRVKAADGKTDLYAALYRAYEKDESWGPLPIIDLNYINSIVSVAPVGFMDAVNSPYTLGVTRLGFHVVKVDGRGTPNRSRGFREAGYPAFADIQIEDHVTAIRQLADRFPSLDAERVGIWGSSNGGAGAARAILRRPDFFKVAVASAGSHDYMSLPPSGIKFFGVPRYADGTAVRPTPDAVPDNYLPFDNAALAANLQGHLLLAYGNMDNLALPTATLRLANALIEAGKTFDLLHMPNRGHFFLFEPYFKKRLRHYFVEHLHGIEPPM